MAMLAFVDVAGVESGSGEGRSRLRRELGTCINMGGQMKAVEDS